jgi:hypothetical protein
MEQLHNIQSVIEYFSTLYSSWQEVNHLFKNKIHNPDSEDMPSQKFLNKFCNKRKDANILQTNLLYLILASSVEKAGVITAPFHTLLKENISFFEENKEIFESLDYWNLINQSLQYYKEKKVSLKKDLELVKTYPYTSEVEKQMLIDEIRKE